MNIKEILKQHAIWIKTNGQEGVKADLRGADLQNVDLEGSNLQDADLRKANLSFANLKYANLQNADLRKANLRNTNFSRTDLREAGCAGADFYGTDLRYSILTRCSLDSSKNIFRFNKLGGRECFAVVHEHGLMVQAGCFWGTIDEFEEADIGNTYLTQIMYLRELEESICNR